MSLLSIRIRMNLFTDRLRERLAARLAPWAVYLKYLDDAVTEPGRQERGGRGWS